MDVQYVKENTQEFKLLVWIADLLSNFLSGGTRRWSDQKVEELLEEWGPGDHDEDDIRAGAGWLVTDEGYNPEESDQDPNDPFPSDPDMRGTLALTVALSHRIRRYWILLIVFPAIYIGSSSWLLEFGLSEYGLVFDMFGAVIVARGILRKPREVARNSVKTTPNHPYGSPEDLLVIAVETVDGIVGVLLLVIGFSLQILDGSSLMGLLTALLLIVSTWAVNTVIRSA